MSAVQIKVDGKVVSKRTALRRFPYARRIIREVERRHRIRATGIMVGVMNLRPTPLVHIKTVNGTETFGSGFALVEVECWGGGGGGVAADNFAGQIGGSAGGYSRCTFGISASSGKTLVHTIGTGGPGGSPPDGVGMSGGNSTVVSGSFSISTITCTGGASGSGGGAGTNANSGAVNVTGGNAGNPSGTNGGTGGAGVAGNITGDGGPYGTGGAGGSAPSGGGFNGQVGAVVYGYS